MDAPRPRDGPTAARGYALKMEKPMYQRKRNLLITLLAEDTKRRVYEGAASYGKDGSGKFYIAPLYSAGVGIELTKAEVDALVADGTLVLDFPGFYKRNLNVPD